MDPAVKPEHSEYHFRAVLGHFATGVAVVTAVSEGVPVGITVQSFSSLSLDPPLVLLSPARTSTSWPHIESARRLCINLLAEGHAHLARQFARSGGDKFQGVDWKPSPTTGSPVLTEALAWIDAVIESVSPGGDHLVVVCRVLDLQARTDLRPLIFYQSGFQSLVDSTKTPLGDVRSAVLAVSNMDAACRFYGEGLGLSPVFRDGDSWAVFSGGHLNIALAGPDQNLPAPSALNIKVSDVQDALDHAVAAGASVVQPISRGDHEIRAALKDPEGHLFYVYSPAQKRKPA